MSDVFISYSRHDVAFTERLHDALSKADMEVWRDVEDIPPAAEWLPEIAEAIDAADSLVFVISPASVASAICGRELEHAAGRQKRIIPVVHRPAERSTIPDALAKRNWISFEDPARFEHDLQILVTAVRTDLDWVKAHTRLLTRAAAWSATRDDSGLLRGAALRDAEAWLEQAGTGKEPPPSALQATYIDASQALREREHQQALALQLAEQAELAMEQDPRLLPRSALLALESTRRYPSVEGYRALRRSLALLPQPSGRIQHGARVFAIAFSRDGRWLASGSEDGVVRVRDVAAGSDVATLQHGNRVSAIAFSRDGRWLAAGSKDQTVTLWDTVNWQQAAVLQHDAEVCAVEFSSDGALLLSATSNLGLGPDAAGPGAAWTWEIGSWRQLFRAPHTHLTAATFVPWFDDGRWVISMGDRNRVMLWEARTGETSGTIQMDAVPKALACHPTAAAVAITADDQLLGLWDLAEAKRVATVELGSLASPVAFSPRGRWFASATGDGMVRVWETGSNHEIAQFHHSEVATALVFSPDEEWLATVCYWQGTIQLWELRTRQERARIVHEHAYAAAFSPDGRLLATAGDQNAAWLWRAGGAGDAVWEARRVGMGAHARFGDDGKRVIVTALVSDAEGPWVRPGDLKRIVRTLDAESGSELTAIREEPDATPPEIAGPPAAVPDGVTLAGKHFDAEVTMTAVTPDGAWVATALADGGIVVWDARTGEELVRFQHERRVNSVAFSPDGAWLVSAGQDEAVRLWRWRREDVVTEAEARVVRDLTTEERRQFLDGES